MKPNRIVAVAASILSLLLAALPLVGNFDWQSTAGVIAGITALLAVTLKWLDGWQAHEARAVNKPFVQVPSVTTGTTTGGISWNEPAQNTVSGVESRTAHVKLDG